MSETVVLDRLEKHILIVAGGNSSRMGNKTPKQFLPLDGIPLLQQTFKAFKHIDGLNYTLVLPQDHIDHWKQLCLDSGFSVPHQIVTGGPTRFHSVKAGLKFIPNGSLVLIHDGARPFPSKDCINDVIEVSTRKGNAVPVVNITDTIREVKGAHNRIANRTNFKLVQTPQGFHSSIIKEAYHQTYDESFTDDASVLESKQKIINLVNGNVENIKISNPLDMEIARSIKSYVESK